MRDFLEKLGNLLEIENYKRLQTEELKKAILQSIHNKNKVSYKLLDVFEDMSSNCEINIKIISLINLLINRIYQEKDKNIKGFISFALEEIARLLPIENLSLMEKDSKRNYLILKFASGKIKIKDFRIKKFPIEDSVSGQAFKSWKYIYIPDTEIDPKFNKKLSNLPIKSLLSVPIKEGDKIIGVMNFSHSIKNAFNEMIIHMLVILTNLFSSILTLFKLYRENLIFNSRLKREVNKKTIEIQRMNIKLYKTSITDPLTGLYNRRFFLQKLEEEFNRFLRYGSNFCLVILDLDKFKYINDTYGHLEGDRILKIFAKILFKRTRKEDVVARIGGDEFACILVGSNIEGAKIFTERIKEDLNINYKKEKLTFCAGVGCLNKEEYFKFYKSYKKFFKEVDKALLKAKKIKDTVKIIEIDK